MFAFFHSNVRPKDKFTKLVRCNLGYALAYYDRDGNWINIYTGKVLQGVEDYLPLPIEIEHGKKGSPTVLF